MKRIEKDFSELDLNAVDLSNGSWSWGRGGAPLCDDEYSISYVDGDLVETRYKLPAFLNEMLEVQGRCSADQVRRNIASVLRRMLDGQPLRG